MGAQCFKLGRLRHLSDLHLYIQGQTRCDSDAQISCLRDKVPLEGHQPPLWGSSFISNADAPKLCNHTTPGPGPTEADRKGQMDPNQATPTLASESLLMQLEDTRLHNLPLGIKESC